MKQFKKIFISVLIFAGVIASGVLIYSKYFYDANQLSVKEKEWLEENKTTLIDFNVPNKLNVFGFNGSGVFFDFIEDFEKKYSITINKVPTEIGVVTAGSGFYLSKDITATDLPIYKDYYVVVSKEPDVITSYSDLSGSAIGITAEALSRVSSSYTNEMTYTTIDNKEELIDSLEKGSTKYLIVPKTEYLDFIIKNDYKIVYHLSDLTINYYFRLGTEEILNSIITKYYNNWIKTEYKDAYYDYSYNLFVDQLDLTQAETDTLTNKDYIYGFVHSTPYQTLASSNYGGIVSSYLNEFSELSGVEFTYTKYKTREKLVKSFNDKKTELMFIDSTINTKYTNIFTSLNTKYYIASPLAKQLTLASVSELSNKKVKVLEDSNLYAYLNVIPEVTVDTVSSEKKLLKSARKEEIIVIDSHLYDYYINENIKNYSIRYTGYTKENYSFQYLNNNDAFYKLFSSYINTLDDNEMIRTGLISYKEAARSGNVIALIAKYTLALFSGILLVSVISYINKNQIKLDTKIRKDEKLKFVDLLTSLKNRNYLNEKKDAWNQNSIYPQGVIIIDLNNVKYLNDTFGHTEGDKQIKAAANVLIKTQLDNTEIIRTDGNEFMVYLVEYSEKQVLNYIKKLLKEFKSLPYEFGAAFGFSMIVDDLKLIDDAINEATIQMRDNKENLGVKNDKI